MMKRFKRQSDLTKYAIRRTLERQRVNLKELKNQMHKAGDFLQNCMMKLRLPR